MQCNHSPVDCGLDPDCAVAEVYQQTTGDWFWHYDLETPKKLPHEANSYLAH